MANRDRTNSEIDQDDQSSESEKQPPGGRKRWKRVLIAIALILLALVLLAPNILGWSGQVGSIANSYAKLKGDLQIDSVSLGWFQKLKLSGVKLVGEDGETIANINEITSSKSLLNIALNQDNPGEFTIDGAQLDLVFWPGGSNLETAIESKVEPKEQNDNESASNSSKTPEFAVHLLNSAITLRKHDATSAQQLTEAKANIVVSPSTGYVIFDISTSTQETGSLKSSGRFEVGFESDNFLRSIECEAFFDGVGCSLLNPILLRAEQQISADGKLDGEASLSFSSLDNMSVYLKNLAASNVVIDAPGVLSADPVSIERLSANGELKVHGSRILSEKFILNSDIANFEFEGSVMPSEILEAFTGSAEIREDFKVNGTVDLALLSRLAPDLLSIRKDVQIDEGKLACEAFCRMENGQRRILVNVELPAMRAKMFESRQRSGELVIDRNRFREINWRQPVRMTASAKQNDSPLWLELLTCESDFLTAQGTTGPDGRGRLVINGDLAQLRNRLQQFIDLSEVRLGGTISGQFDWSKITAEEFEQYKVTNGIATKGTNMPVFQLIGGCTIDQFLYNSGPGLAVREEKLVLRAAVNHAFKNKASRLETAAFEVSSGVDILRASLARPVRQPNFNSTFLANVEIDGDLRTWLRRGRAFATLPKMNLQGKLNGEGRCEYSPEAFALQSKSLTARDVTLVTQSLRIREPLIDAKIKLGYDFASQQLTGHHVSIKTDASAAGCEYLTLDLATERRNDSLLEANVALILNLEEVMSWFQEPQVQCPYRGTLTGEADIAVTGAAIELSLTSDVDQFAYLSFENDQVRGGTVKQGSPIWSEPTAGLNADARYNFLNDSLQLSKLVVDAEGLNLDVHGRITNATTVCNLNLAGTLATDSEKLVRRLRENIGIDLQLKGKDESALLVKGPLFEPDVNELTSKVKLDQPSQEVEQLNARMQIRWDEGSIYGLPFGKSKVALQYDPTQLDIKPINLPLDKGRLNVDPAVLFQDPMLLTLQPGKLVNRANLSPEICRSWLKYVAPMLAEATEAEGMFSVDLQQEAALPLTNPLNGSLDATITLHKADVGPGPLGQQMIAIVNSVRTIVKGDNSSAANSKRVWLQMPQQQINCKIEAGRVYHEKMTFQTGDVQIMTTGSVGADQSIDMLVSIPIRQEWLKDRKLLRSLAGDAKVVQIPIRGTLAKPSFGTNGLKDWTRSFFRGAAENLIQEKAAQFLEDSAGKLLDRGVGEGTGNLLKPRNGSSNKPNGGNGQSLQDAAGKLLEDQLRDNFNRLIELPKQK